MSGDYRRGIVAASPAPDPATGLVTVTVDGTDVVAAALGELPEVGWDVWVEQRGPKAQDWVVVDIQTPTSIRRTFSRYIFGRTASGIAGLAFYDIGTPSTSPWSTGSVASNHSILTITRDCHLDLYYAGTGQCTIEMTILSTDAANLGAVQSGTTYRTALSFSGLLLAGETVDMIARNSTGSSINITARTVLTFCDAHWVVAQT